MIQAQDGITLAKFSDGLVHSVDTDNRPDCAIGILPSIALVPNIDPNDPLCLDCESSMTAIIESMTKEQN
jgi:hypothetical protein